MVKKIILRSLMGIPIGITLSYCITIVLSLLLGNGYYQPCVPELIEAAGSEIRAVLLQTGLSGLLGFGFAAASVVWDIEHWGIVKQTGVYFAIAAVIMMPTAYWMYWMEHSIGGFLSYFGIFALIFAVIWVVQVVIGRRFVNELNDGLRKSQGNTRQ